MPSTPQLPRSTSPLLPPRVNDVAVAPYLTHIVTHHGQMTLIPPQNQGRVRTNKKPRRVKAPQMEQPRHDLQPLPTRPSSSLGPTTPQSGKKRKPARNASQVATNPEDQGPSRAGSTSATSISHLPPPPSYESIRTSVSRTPSNDVIPLPSSVSSSDDFEDITEMDLESQWELDRMAGFTLEERVRREWFRRQAAMGHTFVASSSPPKSPRTARQALPSEECRSGPSGAPSPPPKDYETRDTAWSLPSSPGSEHSNPSAVSPKRSGHRSSSSPHKSPFPAPGPNANSSGSSLEDWDVLESVRPRPTRLSSWFSRKRPPLVHSSGSGKAASFPVDSGARVSDACATSESSPAAIVPTLAASRGRSEPLLSNMLERGPGQSSTQPVGTTGVHGPVKLPNTDTVSDPGSGISQSGETGVSSRLTPKGKERETNESSTVGSGGFSGSKLSAIHRRPLPAPPTSHVSRALVINPIVTIPPLPGNAPDPNLPLNDPQSEEPPLPSTSSDHPTPMTHDSVRDRITKFESMRDRPVPPPPADFLARTRVKRKPPPPPPSSFRRGPSGDFDCEMRSRDEWMGSGPPGAVEASSPRTRIPAETARPPSLDVRDAILAQRPSAGVPESGVAPSRPLTPPRDSHSPSPAEPYTSRLALRDPVLSPESDTLEVLASRDSDPDNMHATPERPEPVGRAAEPASPANPEHRAPGAPVPPIVEILDVEATPGARSPTSAARSDTGLSPYTDLDVLLSRLDDASNGNRYDDLLTVSDILGPAQPQQVSPSQMIADLPLGRIEVMRRRKLQDGRVKLKLSLLGVVVDRCGACLSQFKDAEWAVLLPCLHPFHSTCLQSWLARSHTCPLCRVTLDPPT